MRICSVDGCNNKSRKLGYCDKHFKRFKRHGDPLFTEREMHGKSRTVEYSVWSDMKQRCYLKTNKYYHRYGGRGITVCERWLHSFSNFLEDMGERPGENYELDREDNDKGYYKNNCRWVTQLVNLRNTSRTKLTIDDVREIKKSKLSNDEIANIYNIHKTTASGIRNNRIWKDVI